jgi:AraC family transcriptional regulator of adaptative response / DNA-3-methyladenine glycosylase II
VGVLTVEKGPRSSLTLSLDSELADHSAEIRQRVARQFDVDADVHAINNKLTQCCYLREAITSHPGTRVPGAWDGFETVLRAILGQQVTVKASLTIASRVVSRHSEKLKNPSGSLTALSPSAEDLDNANLDSLGLTGARIKTIHAVANAVVHQGLDLNAGEPHAYIEALTALPGIGDWTAQYVAMRGLKATDAFPAGDLILRRAATTLGDTLSEKQLRELSMQWSPYRAYAVMHLWRSYDAAAFKAAIA